MNSFIGIGRLCDEPNVTYKGDMCIARYTLAINRNYNKNGEKKADFISCVTFNKTAEFAEKYFTKGTKIAVTGRVQTGSYENKNGQKVNTFDVIVDSQEFAESKAVADANRKQAEPKPEPEGQQEFMDVPDDSGLPFNF